MKTFGNRVNNHAVRDLAVFNVGWIAPKSWFVYYFQYLIRLQLAPLYFPDFVF